MPNAGNYRLQESLQGPEGPWKTIYSGSATRTRTTRLSKSWLRVRWEEAFVDPNSLPYASDWSDVAEYNPTAVVLTFAALNKGNVKWAAIPQASTYEVQRALAKKGPWSTVYQGGVPLLPLRAQLGSWYRIRALQELGGVKTDITPWSRPQLYGPGTNFVRASGTELRDANGNGDPLVLTGVNVGGAFVIEPWMTGLGQGDSPALIDDWSIRERMISRFGAAETDRLLKIYQQAYLTPYDYDRLLDRGVTVVRLPVYYRNFMDDNGVMIPGEAPFALLNQVVNGLADRGIYTLIDMHGAPGLQSADATTGRAGFNKLFASDGEVYRQQTEDLWKAIASHFKNNPWVLGYDLLNEPLGAAPDADLLANVYDRLYRAIRSVDPNHLIVMEGIWYTDATRPPPNDVVDWDTLPPPQHRQWTNVMYQFHFYHWQNDENLASHKAFIDQKLAAAALKQPLYNVPVMIGEFYGFNIKGIWDYYIDSFNAQKWSWTTWSYKYHDSPSTWGLVSHARYDESLPNFSQDSNVTLQRKLAKYTTADYHNPTVTLQNTLQTKGIDLASAADPGPVIGSVSPRLVKPGQTFTVHGWSFGASQIGGRLSLNGIPLQVASWSDRMIQGVLPVGLGQGSGTVDVQTTQGTSPPADLIFLAVPPTPVLSTFSDQTFTLQGSELGDTPGSFQFYPAPCNPQWAPACNRGDAGITYWSPMLVTGVVPPDAADLSGRFTVQSREGGPLYPTMVQP